MNEQFHEERRTGIGGSDAAAVVGMSPFMSAHDVYMQKLGLVEPTEATGRMVAGNRLEPVIGLWYEDSSGHRLVKPEEMVRHPKHPFVVAHLDGLVYNGSKDPICIAEIKNVGLDMAYLWGDSGDQIPDYYNLQCQHNMLAASGHYGIDFDHCVVPVLVGGNDYRLYNVPFDEKLVANLLSIETDFWENNVKRQVPPAVDGSAGAVRMLAQMYPRSNELEVSADAEIADVARDYLVLRAKIDALETEKTKCENLIKEKLGDAGIMGTPHGRFTWKSQTRRSLDGKGLAEHLLVSDDVIKLFTKESEFRRFNPPRRKK